MEERQRKIEFELELKRQKWTKDRKIRNLKKDRKIELELNNKELEHKVSLAASQSTFDVSKHIRFVPPFQEKEVDITVIECFNW